MSRHFTNIADQISYPVSTVLSTDEPREFSFSCWVSGFMNSKAPSSADSLICQKSRTDSNYGLFTLMTHDSLQGYALEFRATDWSVSYGNWLVMAPPDNAAHHVAVTYDFRNVAAWPLIYIDGRPCTILYNQPASGTFHRDGSTYPLTIGGQGGNGTGNWVGDMEHIAWWWGKRLTPDEILKLSLGASPLMFRPELLKLYLPLTQDGVKDRSPGNAGRATVTGTTPGLQPLVKNILVFAKQRRNTIIRKGFLPAPSSAIAGQSATSGGGVIVVAPGPALVGQQRASVQGTTIAKVVKPVLGQGAASGQGALGPTSGPLIKMVAGQQAAGSPGAIVPEVAESLAGQPGNTQQGTASAAAFASVRLGGQQASGQQGSIKSGPGFVLPSFVGQSRQGMVFIQQGQGIPSQTWTTPLGASG